MTNVKDKIKWNRILILILTNILISTFLLTSSIKTFEIEPYKIFKLYSIYMIIALPISMFFYALSIILHILNVDIDKIRRNMMKRGDI